MVKRLRIGFCGELIELNIPEDLLHEMRRIRFFCHMTLTSIIGAAFEQYHPLCERDRQQAIRRILPILESREVEHRDMMRHVLEIGRMDKEEGDVL